MDKNYEVIVQARAGDKKVIVDALNDGQPIMVIAETERKAEGRLNRKYHVEIDKLAQQGEVEFVIRPFLSS